MGGKRTHISSQLMRESLMDKRVMAATDTQQVTRILRDLNIVSLGGLSILDRGKDAIVPLLNEIVWCRAKHDIVCGSGLEYAFGMEGEGSIELVGTSIRAEN